LKIDSWASKYENNQIGGKYSLIEKPITRLAHPEEGGFPLILLFI